MIVEQLALQDFRNYATAKVDFPAGLTLVTGRNAQGKTNLLEAVYCLSGLGSPRSSDARLVREGAEKGYVHGRVRRGERAIEIDLELQPGRAARALMNKSPIPSTRSLGEVFVAVFFGPDDLLLIKGPPDARRRFADEMAVKLKPAREGQRREWERVLRQRNSLLKSAPRGTEPGGLRTLDVWDESFCRLGAALAAERLRAVARGAPFASALYSLISGGDSLRLSYESQWLDQATCEKSLTDPDTVDEDELFHSLAASLETVRVKELERGVSLVGPQRDDIVIHLRTQDHDTERDARALASQGEQRSAALALKLAEYELLTEVLGEPPPLLLDDVFSELDESRRGWLAEGVRAKGQTIVSSAEPTEVVGFDQVLEVNAGEVRIHE